MRFSNFQSLAEHIAVVNHRALANDKCIEYSKSNVVANQIRVHVCWRLCVELRNCQSDSICVD